MSSGVCSTYRDATSFQNAANAWTDKTGEKGFKNDAVSCLKNNAKTETNNNKKRPKMVSIHCIPHLILSRCLFHYYLSNKSKDAMAMR